jgi:hypothetical protein
LKPIQQLENLISEAQASAPSVLGNSGPKTIPGKQRVAMNGVTHGLTGQNVFLEVHEYRAYMDLGVQYIAELRPVGVRETQIAQKIIDHNWRLNTISAVENNLFSSTIIASLHPHDLNDDKTIGMVAKADAWRTDCEGPNAFEKLGRYEARLQRAQYKLTEEFERLQAIRLRKAPDSFVQSECKAWLWYDTMLALYKELAAARLAGNEAARVSQTDSTTSKPELLCKTAAPGAPAVFAAAASSFMNAPETTPPKEKGPRISKAPYRTSDSKSPN